MQISRQKKISFTTTKNQVGFRLLLFNIKCQKITPTESTEKSFKFMNFKPGNFSFMVES